MKYAFTKMHGLGNDFVVFDAFSQPLELTPEQFRHIGDRNFGIGCDQILLVEPPTLPDTDFNYRIFNADGDEVEQCGNGARCFARYVHDKGLTDKREIRVGTKAGVITLLMEADDMIRVNMGVPVLEPGQIPFVADQAAAEYQVEVQGETLTLGVVSMGNPHAVMVVDNLEHAPLEQIGSALQQHPRFPQRVNVGFMQILSADAIALRVFERGVGETLACGTGACAAVVSGRLRGLLNKTVKVSLPGGSLMIEWPDEQAPVLMYGPAASVLKEASNYELTTRANPGLSQIEQNLIEYLNNHPDFFDRHPELLTKLELPHNNGNTVSLIERQVAVLREQAEQDRQKLEEFVAIARENELLNERLHRLTVKLIECCDFEEVINTLQDLLHDDFRAEAVELHLYSASAMEHASNPDLDGFRDFLDGNRPRCGRLPAERLEYLFGPQAEDIASTALIPIRGEGLLGVLAIGSHSEHRFHPGMGTDYLIRLGEIVSKTLEVVSEPGS